MRIKKFLTLVIIVLICLCNITLIGTTTLSLISEGMIGYSVPTPSSNVKNLQDTAYTYTGADIVVYDYGVEIDGHVTIVVIDEGLKDKEWKALEQNPEANVDIVGFLTESTDGSLKWITNPDDPYLDDQVNSAHGFAVISVIASIARDVEIIFIDMDMNTIYGNDPYGFEIGEYKIWNWIDTYQSAYDIDIVTWSQSSSSDFADSTIIQKWVSLINKGVILLSSVGNEGNYLNTDGNSVSWSFPQYYTDWYGIGSIDHENRYDSTKNQRSSFSSWYLSYTSGNHIVNWLEPGNGIPVLTSAYYDSAHQCYRGTWRYKAGTSYSCPYLAAVIALIITGYHNGIESYVDPTVQKVMDILQYSSSRSTFDQKMGFGYVDVYTAYGKAFTEGRLAS